MSCIIDSLLFFLIQLAQWYHTLTAPKYQPPTSNSPLSSSTIYYAHRCDFVDLTVWFPCLRSLSSWLSSSSWLKPKPWAEQSSLPMSWLCLPSLAPFLGLPYSQSTCAFCAPVICSFFVGFQTHTMLFYYPLGLNTFFLLFRMASFLLYSLLQSTYSFFKIQLNDEVSEAFPDKSHYASFSSRPWHTVSRLWRKPGVLETTRLEYLTFE